MNYKNALVALAATVTLGITPALAGVNANAASTQKNSKKTSKTTSKKTSKKTSTTTPKASSSYWTKTARYVETTKDVKGYVGKLVTQKVNGQKTQGVVLTKKTKTIKKGYKSFIIRSNNVWMFVKVDKKNVPTYYIINDSKLTNSSSWLKVTKQATSSTTNNNSSSNNSSKNTSNNSSNNTNSTNNKQVVTVSSNYQTVTPDFYQATDYGNAYLAFNSKAYTANGVTINPGDQYQVKAINTGSSLLYQLQMGGQTVTVPESNDLQFTNINVFPYTSTSSSNSSSSSSSTTYYLSKYAPDSSDAKVSSTFKASNGTLWYVVKNASDKTPTNIYVFISDQNKWVKQSVSNGQIVYDYK